jgi:hypothetical protein
MTVTLGATNDKIWQTVGEPNQPLFGSYGVVWGDANAFPSWSQYGAVAFYIDPFNVVHLRGWAYEDPSEAEIGRTLGDPIPSGPIFTLPPGFRPDVAIDFPCILQPADLVLSNPLHSDTTRCEISPTGDVTVPQLSIVTFRKWVVVLDEIVFHAAPPNQ